MAGLILINSFRWKQKGSNIFWLFGSPMNISYKKQQINKKSLFKKCVKSIHESIQLNKRKAEVRFQHNETTKSLCKKCVKSIHESIQVKKKENSGKLSTQQNKNLVLLFCVRSIHW